MKGVKDSAPQAICHPDRKAHAKGLCRQCYQKSYNPRANELRAGKDRLSENHTPKAKLRRNNWQSKNRNKVNKSIRANHIMRNFNMTVEQYESKLASQNNLCALCKTEFYGEFLGGGDPVLDHSHDRNKVRDFLHRMCNTALGQLRDDPAICRLAAEYLERHKEISV
jgi:recombination endonuclease VII